MERGEFVKPGYVLGLIVAGFVVGGLVCRPDRTGEAAQHRADSLAVIVDSLTVRDTRRQADSVVAEQRLAAIAAHDRRQTQFAQRTLGRLDSLAQLVLDTASLVPRPVYDSTLAAFRDLVLVREAQRDSSEAKATIWQARWTSADSLAREWRQVSVRLQGELAAALKRGNSRWGCTAGVGATAGLSQYGAGLGFTCGRGFF